MLEVKDFCLGVPNRTRFDNVPMMIAVKARDTVAGVVGGSHCASGNERTFFSNAYQKMARPPRVIYFFEDLATPARRPPQRALQQRNVLLNRLKRHLRWLTRDIAVVGLSDYGTFIPGLTVRRTS